MSKDSDFETLYKARMIEASSSPGQGRSFNLRTLILHYKGHIRAHPFHELFALLGVAAGVALLFAVQVANKSITGSFEDLSKGIAGRATLEVATRIPQGFDQTLYRQIRKLKSVEAAAPVTNHQIAIRGPLGRQPLTLVGIDERLGVLGGDLVTNASKRGRNLSKLGLQLTEPISRKLGVVVGDKVSVGFGEQLMQLAVVGTLSSEVIGDLAQSPVAVVPLGLAQDITDTQERITRVLVAPQRGQEAAARSDLKHLAGQKLDVRDSNTEAKLLRQAATSDRQSTALFSVISLVVGILLVFNAMLLSLSDRRKFISTLRSWGFPTATIISSIAFDALILGVIGSLLGLVIGDQLSRHVLNEVPNFLSYVFPIGSQRVVDIPTVLVSFAAGIAAVFAAIAKPAIEIVRTAPGEQFLKYDFSLTDPDVMRSRKRLFLLGLGLIAASAALALIDPKAALLTVAGLVIGLVVVLPATIAWLIKLGQRAARHSLSAIPRISLGELAITPTRATALATTGALAVFAIVTISGVAKDLDRGGRKTVADIYSNADLFVTQGKGESFYRTGSFNHQATSKRLQNLPEVKSVRVYRGGFLDKQDRRILVMAPPRDVPKLLADSQIVKGERKHAEERLRRGGWVALSSALAKEGELKVGQRFSLPTPTGNKRLRLAAIINNHGWFPGALLMNSDSYRHLWGTNQASILEVDLKPGVAASDGKDQVHKALGSSSALEVYTAAQRRELSAGVINQGLSRLNQISTIVIVAVVLAVAAAMLGSIWQRRQRLWSLVSMGISRRSIYSAVFLEAALILILGGILGAALGLVGQALGGRWLELTTDSPVPFTPAWATIGRTLGLMLILASASILLTLRFALPLRARVSLRPE